MSNLRTQPATWSFLAVLLLGPVSVAQSTLVPPGRSPSAQERANPTAPPAGPRAVIVTSVTGDELLKPGDPAPLLTDVDWIQGEPISAWQPGRITVIEFWATWCPACRHSLPTLAEVAGTYAKRKVDVVAVAIWPRPGMEPTAEFVAKREDVMPFRVAEDRDGRTARAFMTAAGQNAIPTAMVVDGSGRIAWIGHPEDGLKEALEGLVDKNRIRQMMIERSPERRAIDAAAEAGDWNEVAVLSNQLYRQDRTAFGYYAVMRYAALVRAGRADEARAWAESMEAGDFANSAPGLNLLAWTIVDPNGDLTAAQRDLDLALRLAERADELTDHEDAYILDTLARVVFLRGNPTEALRLQMKAVARSAALRGRQGAEVRAELQQRLVEYTQAAEAAED